MPLLLRKGWPPMPKISELESTLRGLERCGYHVYAVGTAEEARGIVTLFPNSDEGKDATPRTVTRGLREWDRVKQGHSPRTLLDHLVATGRTEEATRCRLSVLT